MKTINFFTKIAGLAICAALLMTGCILDVPTLGKNANQGMGTVELNIAGSPARSVIPDLSGVTYKVTASASGVENQVFEETSFELAAGTWNFTIDALNDITVIGTASASGINVIAGGLTLVDVILAPVTDGSATGTLEWKLTFPAGVDSAELAYYDAEDDVWVELTPTAAGTQAFAPGSYLVRSALSGSGGTAGDLEAVHIYNGLTTKLEWAYAPESLIIMQAFAGSVSFSSTDSSVVITGVKLELTGNNDMTDQELVLTSSAGTWTFATEIPETTDTLGGTLFISTVNNGATPLEYTLTDTAYAANVNFGTVTIVTLTATVGENGTLRVDNVALADNAKRDIIAGSDVSIRAIANAGNQFGTLTVGGTNVGAASYTIENISADTTVAVTFIEGLDPNVIFEWSQAVTPWAGLNQNTASVNNYVILDDVNYPTIQTRAYSTANAPVDPNGGGALLNNARLVFGQDKFANTSANDTWISTDLGGQFDLSSRPFRITIDYTNLSGTAATRTRVYLNNNGTGQGAGALANASRILDITSTETFPTTPQVHLYEISSGVSGYQTSSYRFLTGSDATSGTVVIDVDPVAYYADNNAQYQGLKDALVTIHSPSNSNTTITGFKIEYTDAMGALEDVKIYQTTNAAGALKIAEDIDLESDDDPIQLYAGKVPASAAGTITWETGNASVVTIVDGLLTIVGVGETTISAKVGTTASTINVTVTEPIEPEALAILRSGADVTGTTISVEEGASAALTASILPEGAKGTVTWASSSADVSVSTSGLVRGETAGGSAVITATLVGSEPAITATVTVNVTTATTDPNVIWQWRYGDDNGIQTGSTGTYLIGTGSNAYAAEMPFGLSGNVTNDTGAKGIRVNASGTSNVYFQIGSTDITQTQTTSAPAGVFDFRNGNTNGIRVTMEVAFTSAAAGSRSLNVNLSHNSATGGNSPLNASPTNNNAARIFYWQNGAGGATGAPSNSANDGNYDYATGTITSAIIMSTYSGNNRAFNNIEYLEKTFVAVLALANASDAGANFVVKSITIAYEAVIAPESIEITSSAAILSGTGNAKTTTIDLEGLPTKTVALGATVLPANATGSVSWTSSNTTAVSVNATSGSLTINGTGTATITATIGTISATLAVTVVNTKGAANITINPEADFSGLPEGTIIASGQTITLDKTYSSVSWLVDGQEKGTANSFTLTASDYSAGTHNLTVVVIDNGHIYSKTVSFTVAD